MQNAKNARGLKKRAQTNHNSNKTKNNQRKLECIFVVLPLPAN